MNLAFPKRSRRIAALLAAAAGAGAGACSIFGEPNVAKAPYETVAAWEDVEVRAYPALLVAATTASGDFDDATEEAFGRLFDYISGANEGGREIAMTSPVLQAREGARIAMTSPVLQEKSGAAWRLAFVLPEDLTLETAPKPRDPAVRIERIAPERVAALRFTGLWDEERLAAKAEELRASLAARGIEAAGEPRFAGYNPPWTIPFLRRNEVLIPLR